MRRTRSTLLVLSAALAATLAAASAAQGVSGGTDPAAPSFTDFVATTYQDTDTQYIVNGDEVASTKGDLRQFYDRLVTEPDTSPEGLIVNTVSGRDDKWSASQALNLTYCVSTKFGADYTAVVNAMAGGTALWEGATSKVNFTYVPSADSSCTTRNKSILFSVEPTTTTQYIARAFFPSTSTRSRNILVNAKTLQSNSRGWSPTNILGHELGHVLGFRHEHTRPEAGTCFEDNNWRPLTPYDSASIMHYPQCNGTSSDLSMTASDRAGVQSLYGV